MRQWLSAGVIMGMGLAASVVQAHEHHAPHVHGEAVLNVAVEGETVTIELEGALANVLSFEHAPATEAQRAEALAAIDRLREPLALFRPDPAAACTVGAVNLHADGLEDLPADGPAHAHDHHHDADDHEQPRHHDHDEDHDHADMRAVYTLICARIERLTHLDTAVFTLFPALETLDTRIVTATGQRAVVLTPDRPRLDL